jgi:hypothetical protein
VKLISLKNRIFSEIRHANLECVFYEQNQGGQAVSIEERILIVAAGISWTDSRELRAIALEVRKREDRIKQLEDRIHRAAMAFFRDGSDGQVASGMLAILEEERRRK